MPRQKLLIISGVAIAAATVIAVVALIVLGNSQLPSYQSQIASISIEGLTEDQKDDFVVYYPADYVPGTTTGVQIQYASPAANSLGGNNNIGVNVSSESFTLSSPSETSCKELADGVADGLTSGLSLAEQPAVSDIGTVVTSDTIGCAAKITLDINEQDFIIEVKALAKRGDSKVYVFAIAYDGATQATEIGLLKNALNKSYLK